MSRNPPTSDQRVVVRTDGKVCIGEFAIPRVTGKQNFDGSVDLTLDGRFGIRATAEDELQRWGTFCANAMAIAAGFTSFGEGSEPRNDYGKSAQMAPAAKLPKKF